MRPEPGPGPALSRRSLLAGAGAIVVAFALPRPAAAQGAARATLPGSLGATRALDAWIRIDAEGRVTVFTGKAELGQGIKTAIVQVAAEELDLAPAAIRLVTADTALTPNEGYTAGSQSMQNSATAVRLAAAEVRAILVAAAAERLGVPADRLTTADSRVAAPDGRSLGYGEIAAEALAGREAQPGARPKDPAQHRIVGRDLPRLDIPAKVTGGEAYVHDLRLPGMVHGRVVRPPSPGARLAAVETGPVERMPGVVAVVRDGGFLAVAAEREFQAVQAMRALERAARWEERSSLPAGGDLFAALQAASPRFGQVARRGTPGPEGSRPIRARFTRPYQMHGSIGPSCAVAYLDGGRMTVWSHTQGVFPDRAAIAEMLGMAPETVRVIHAEGSGCYGHNGADDAAAEAALIARAVPGRPVRLQWMREQEHGQEPYGPAMVIELEARLGGDGRIADWRHQVWSNTHATRPGPAGSLLAPRRLGTAFAAPEPDFAITPAGSGDRNAVPLYAIPDLDVVWHFLPDMPLRVSALRALGAYANVFAIESFIDELAAEAGADPVAFRLRHLDDARARDVVTAAAERFGWGRGRPPAGHGHGFAFARYKNLAAYLAVALEAAVEPLTGRVRVVRVAAAIDAGEAVNPDGLRNQTEGGILQSISWTLYEQVAFDATRIVSLDWASYPILRFQAVPEKVEVAVLDRKGAPFLGAGEAAQGPAAAALANALAAATGHRFRDLPLTRERVAAAG